MKMSDDPYAVTYPEYVVLDWAEDEEGVRLWDFPARLQFLRTGSTADWDVDSLGDARSAVVALLQRHLIALVELRQRGSWERVLDPDTGRLMLDDDSMWGLEVQPLLGIIVTREGRKAYEAGVATYGDLD